MRNCDTCGGKKWIKLVDRKTGLQKQTPDGRLLYQCFRSPHHIQAEEPPFLPVNERGMVNKLYFDLEVSKSLYYSYGRKVKGEWLRGADLVHEYFIISWAASYIGSGKIFSACVTQEQALGWTDAEILAPLHDLLSSADILVGHNVDAYDLKRVNTRFLINGWTPITNHDGKQKKTEDSLKIVRSRFAFEDNTLDALCVKFGIRGKDKITDDDWREVLRTGNPKILAKIDKYCRGDVRNGKKMYEIFAPYAGKADDYGIMKSKKETK